MIFIATINSKVDMVGVEPNKIDNAVIDVKILTIIEGIMGMTFLEFLVAGIAETVIDNLGQ